MYNRVEILSKIGAPEALEAARRLLSQGVVNPSSARAGCHLHSLRLAAVERLERLVEDGDFILESTFDATPEWRVKVNSALEEVGETFIILHYGWGMFSISCTDLVIRMRRSGEDRGS